MEDFLIILKVIKVGVVRASPYILLAVFPSLALSNWIMKKVYQELELHQDHIKK